MSQQLSEPNGYRLSFLELIELYQRVEIPMIQRDYAQGRKSAGGVRKRFLTNLLDALKSGESLSLDFVYGEDTEGRCFQPIDGQQRLTTLFLLHWFLACAVGKSGDFRKRMKDEGGEARFRYAVRPSSDQFFLKLLDYCPEDLSASLAENIKDQAWFFRSWLHDQTIVGALAMLDAIQEMFANESECENFYLNLSDSAAALISMDVLSLGSLGLSDEIYVKMNARGKELTGFEKFKAWLIEHHREDLGWSREPDGSPSWTVQLDGDWLNLFWHFHHDEKDPAEFVSQAYFRTFVALAVNYHASEGRFQIEWGSADADDQEALWRQIFSRPCVERVFEDLHFLATQTHEAEWPIEGIRRRLVACNVGPFNSDVLAAPFLEEAAANVTYEMRVWLHAVLVFLRGEMPPGGEDEMHWFRIVRNLLANTRVDADNFVNVIKGLVALASSVADHGSVLKALISEVPIVGFQPDQFQEEKRKARLIDLSQIGRKWAAAIILAESHVIFRGQIELMLPVDDDYEAFENRWAVFDQLFDDEGSRIGKGEFLVARAALAHSEAIKLDGQKRICLRDSRINWSELLTRGCEWPQFGKAMVELIDSLVGKVDLAEAMQHSLESPHLNEPWMVDIIRFGNALFGHSTSIKIQNYYGNGVFLFHKEYWNEGDILLGAKAVLRNRLIDGLVHNIQLPWEIAPNAADWRRLPIDQSPGTVFFKGHHIILTQDRGDDGAAWCRFEYDKAVVGGGLQSDWPEISVPYPEDGAIEEFHVSVKIALAAASPSATTVLLALDKACRNG